MVYAYQLCVNGGLIAMNKRLAPGIEAAWGIRERPARGPKPGLTLERITTAAVKIASTEGLSAVSMSRVAAKLGVATMALYRYVRSKNELLTLMVDEVFRTPPATQAKGEDWRLALAWWAREHLAVLRRHPWVVRVPLSGPPITPNLVLWFEAGLSALRETGLTEAQKLPVLLLVNGFVRNEMMFATDLAMAAEASGAPIAAPEAYGKLLAQLIDPKRFPAIGAVLAAGVFEEPDDADSDAQFNFGLERILDGIAVLVRKR
jgi:AcrR family transcriptional regulator